MLKEVKITDELQEEIPETNVSFLKFIDGEKDPSDFNEVIDNQIKHYRQAQTYAFIVHEIVTDEMKIFNMPPYLKGQLIVYLKTVLDCIDHVLTTGENTTD